MRDDFSFSAAPTQADDTPVEKAERAEASEGLVLDLKGFLG